MGYFAGARGAMYMEVGTLSSQRNTFPKDPVAKVINWQLQSAIETVDVTTLQDTDRVFTPGVKSYSGSAEILYYKAPGKQAKFASILSQIWAPRKPDSTPDDNQFDSTGISKSPGTIGFRLMITDYNPAYAGFAEGPEDDNEDKRTLFIDVRTIITTATLTQSTADVCRGSIGFQVIGAPVRVNL